MAVGTPIRLVQDNGNLTELEATVMVMTTTRKVGGSALPFTGSKRIGLDLNVNQGMINIQGIISDDREGTSGTAATSLINFGRVAGSTYQTWATHTNFDRLFRNNIQQHLTLTDVEGVNNSIPMRRASSGQTAYTTNVNGANTNGIFICHSGTTPTATDMATALHTYITNNLSAKFTSVIKPDTQVTANGNETANCAVEIQQVLTVSTGSDGNNQTPAWGTTNTVVPGEFQKAHMTSFKGGTDKTIKSAGDKAQDIYGVINNSVTRAARMVGAGLAGAGALLAIVGTGGGAGVAMATAGAGAGVGVIGGAVVGMLSDEISDYFCGLQIPFNSMIKATDGELYTARNFFMPTGWKHGKDKTSESSLPASAIFSHSNEYTGIQGAVQKMDITYNAGEAIYEFNMIFAPIDALL